MENYIRLTANLLRQLGVNASYTGFKYTVCAVVKNIQNPDLITYICKGLYANIAIENHVNISCVERNIRTIVETIWKSGDRELLNEVCGRKIMEKPKNTFFIDVISQYIIDLSDE
ncbi:sporulation initiation factor Spo0A C-terminal domain-containing protein [uncultured Eubacterium sp.]|uniref:sporulation initiation factor Spo0A C-terminal domain-containing protein n=1 Tax=uncultured Eubacterium sp. TaxID=165185 RepID=UPI0026721F51|nr:sporulation initiation factor Spo0A C-terminal domain-containing protein [uncultured Eubacterium sp.]